MFGFEIYKPMRVSTYWICSTPGTARYQKTRGWGYVEYFLIARTTKGQEK